MIRVGILRGGNDYENSLSRGGILISHILENLSHKYKPLDILVDKDGAWHAAGRPVLPADLMHKVDVVWNMADPAFSPVLKSLSVPHVAGNIFPEGEGRRAMLAEYVKGSMIKLPRHVLIPAYLPELDGPEDRYAMKKAMAVFEKFGGPWTVKAFSGSGTGIRVARTFPELFAAIGELLPSEQSIIVEELISGTEATVHALSGFRGQDSYVFPPGAFSAGEKQQLMDAALSAHRRLGFPHYLKLDMTIHPKFGVHITNAECVPDLSPDSHFSNACREVGAQAHHVADHIINLALEGK